MSRNHHQGINEAYFNGLRSVELIDNSQGRYPSQIITAQWNAPATRIAASKTDGSLKIWKVGSFDSAPVTIDRPHHKAVESLDWKPTTETILATAGDDKYIIEWNTVRGQALNKIDTGEERVFIVKYSGDGKFMAAASKKNAIIIIDVEKHTIVTKLQLSDYDIYSMTWNNNSSFLFVGLNNGHILVYKFVNEELNLIHTMKGHRSSIISLFFDRRAKSLLAGSKEGVISLWALEDFKVIRTISEVDQAVSSVCLSRDASYIAATFEDGAPAAIYEIDSLKLIHQVTRCVSGTKSFPVFEFCPIRSTYLYSTPEGRLYITMRDTQQNRKY